MPKLQQREINALVHEISQKINDPIRARNKAREDEAKEIFEGSEKAETFKSLFTRAELDDYYVKNALRLLRDKTLNKVKVEQIVGESEIERRVILSNIDVLSVDDLIDNVVRYFKNK